MAHIAHGFIVANSSEMKVAKGFGGSMVEKL